MKKMEPQENDGWSDEEYDFGHGPELDRAVEHILNEACHTFHHHASGVWASGHKETYARMLVPLIEQHPSLIGQLKQLDDRVVKMVLYRAVELAKEDEALGTR